MLEYRTLTNSLKDYSTITNLLSQLTTVGKSSYKQYCEYMKNLNVNQYIYFILDNKVIVGTGSVLIEKKIIHRFQSVAHIEDIVIDKKHRGKKYGKHLINYLVSVALNKGCYKVILDCSTHNIGFYEACGFSNKGNYMAFYLT